MLKSGRLHADGIWGLNLWGAGAKGVPNEDWLELALPGKVDTDTNEACNGWERKGSDTVELLSRRSGRLVTEIWLGFGFVPRN